MSSSSGIRREKVFNRRESDEEFQSRVNADIEEEGAPKHREACQCRKCVGDENGGSTCACGKWFANGDGHDDQDCPAKCEAKRRRVDGGVGSAPVSEPIVVTNPKATNGRGSAALHWCFTWNNYSQLEVGALVDECNRLNTPGYTGGPFSHIAFSREVGASGTPHLQGFCTFRKKQHKCQVGLLARASGQHRRGTVAENLVYIGKEGGRIEEGGVRPKDVGANLKGRDSPFNQLRDLIKNGGDTGVILEEMPGMFFRYEKTFSKAKAFYDKSAPREPVKIHWYYGETGAGKSYSAEQEAMALGLDVYRQNGSGWWCGYEGEKGVIIDDFEFTCNFNFKQMLKVLDQYKLLVPTKGGGQWLKATHIWVTSSFNPTEKDEGGQLVRRIHVLKEKKKADRPDIMSLLMGAKIVPAKTTGKEKMNEAYPKAWVSEGDICDIHGEMKPCENCMQIEMGKRVPIESSLGAFPSWMLLNPANIVSEHDNSCFDNSL